MKKKYIFLAILVVLIAIFSYLFLIEKPYESDEKVVVFYVPHPDDETLFMTTAIINKVKEDKEVHIVSLTSGDKSGAIYAVNSLLEMKGFEKISVKDFTLAREEELKDAVKTMGVKEKNIEFLRIPDQEVTIEKVRKEVLKNEKKYKDVNHIALLPWELCKSDEEKMTHPDHKNSGSAVYRLKKEGKIKRASFASYIEGKNYKTRSFSLTEDEMKIYLKSMSKYQIWNPKKGQYSIGLISVKKIFRKYTKDPVYDFYLYD